MDIKSVSPLNSMNFPGTDKINQDQSNPTVSFGDYLNNAIGQVNDLQQESQAATQALATGEVSDISQVMIASQKADLALQLTVQIRNKVVEAYQEIMRMQI